MAKQRTTAGRLVVGRRGALRAWAAVVCGCGGRAAWSAEGDGGTDFGRGKFTWQSTGPLLGPAERPDDVCVSVKDPTIVRHGERWHLFCTIRSQRRSHQIEYLSFADWPSAGRAPRQVLTLSDGYFCAPQVFYFRPQRKWYLVYQVAAADRPVRLQPAYSTADVVGDPAGWSKPRLLFERHPETVTGWIDFWVICDGAKAHLFFTSNNGKLWRCATGVAAFPHGWSEPQVVLEDDLFEASHTYRLQGREEYLTIVEAVRGGGRYYKAYLADRLDGTWRPLAARYEQPFASPVNVRHEGPAWTDSYSHGELLRSGYDERLEVDPARLEFLYQGVRESDAAGKAYGEIPWRLGLLRAR